MTRMEAIRKQYEGSSLPTGNQPPRRASRVYPRNRFWRWFWCLLLLSILGGFFGFKDSVIPWFSRLFGIEESCSEEKAENTALNPGFVATHQGASPAEGGVQTPEGLAQYVTPSDSEMNQLFEYVRNSSHVKDNVLYANIMSSVRFGYDSENDVVNAYAGVVKVKETDKNVTPVIFFLGGAARFGRLAALAIAAERGGDKGAASRFVRAIGPADCSKMDMAAVERIIRDAKLASALADSATVNHAKSVAAGLMLGIISHEAGHQALGHCLKRSGGAVNLEISRNQEREADSFSSSVIASSPFGDYILAGTLFWHYALANQQGETVETTHPLSKERFENFVRANSELAASLGIVLK